MDRWNDELYHYGVQGMKWGVRRYQNADGTLTPKGKKKYYTNGGLNEKGKKVNAKARARYESYKGAVEYALNRVNPKFKSEVKKNHELGSAGQSEYFKIARQISKNNPKYDFDTVREKTSQAYANTNAKKEVIASRNRLKKYISEAALASPNSKLHLEQLKEDEAAIERMNFGEQVIKELSARYIR